MPTTNPIPAPESMLQCAGADGAAGGGLAIDELLVPGGRTEEAALAEALTAGRPI